MPFTIACGHCFFCKEQLWSLCDNSNPNAWMAEKLYGYSASGLFGYSHMYGGYAGGQAEYVRVPFADVGPLQGARLADATSRCCSSSDIFPTGYMAAENCNIKPGDTVAVWGCGPVGQFAIQSAYLLGAERVIAIDRFPERLALAASSAGPRCSTTRGWTCSEALRELTGGQGPDACIDAVGLEAHGTTLDACVRPRRRRRCIWPPTGRTRCARRSGVPQGRHRLDSRRVRRLARQVPARRGVRQGADAQDGADARAPLHAAAARRIERGDIDPSFIITHRVALDDAPEMYQTFRERRTTASRSS